MPETDYVNAQPTDSQLAAKEAGLNRLPEAPRGLLPPGGGQFPVPHHDEFVGLINQFARAYRWTFDEALRDSPQSAVKMRNDIVLMGALRERQMMTAQLPWHLEPRDPTDPAQVEAAAKLEATVRRTPHLQKMLMLLEEAVWYGRFAVQLTYEWDLYDPTQITVREFSPINGDSLVARWGGDWGLLVNGQFEGTTEPYERGFVHYFTPAERAVTIVHSHEPEAADFREPQAAGGVKGVGVRGRLYWYWWLKSQFLALYGDYIERFANGIWIAYYDQNNPQAKTEITNAVAGYKANRVLLFPTTESNQTPYRLEIKDPPTAPPGLLQSIIDYLDRAMVKYILGVAALEELNVGGDGADFMTSKSSRTVKYDAQNLAETLTHEWLPVLAKYNTPGQPPPYWRFDTDRAGADRLLSFAERIAALGGAVSLGHLYDICGLPQPGPEDQVASKVQPLSPMGIDQQPIGIPQVGPAGPAPQTVPASVQVNSPVDPPTAA